mmetsp:Transcript_14435/g.25193  ORF Transcript_14435/g.25193 Transcript_14435/m.25193 type:complete len:410 (+) Transcript_14435:94-1323(+)|eukprot:CAMPEP_0119105104 /NCGR_PEP_ID=MMETSP1180-20130426/3162_1 /TAXON_ID=3052 ORGANISM="Chlamydomonas cf sp, Strain CCMP681" /NCGR_SAMPLE_ID=MMETSP1180 /ASSEMBLY_ACC=CAM_ASM_000741 /LENGTH=409 /DNA_ID=CAMNT_0007090081 /DNA_START=73 /DNA_END=1302 /DNA_ORIENTATION=+
MSLMNPAAKIPPEIQRLAAEQTQELSHVDAGHVYSAIKHMLDKLALVGIINVDPKVQAQELTQSVGEEITRMIEQQKDLEHRFEELVTAQHSLRQLPNKAKLRENQVELQTVAAALRQSTKTLCRNLKDNPNVAENMAKVAAERQALCLLLSSVLGELEVFRKVTPTVEAVLAAESAKVAQERTIEHERTTTAAVKQLRSDLKDEKSDHEDKTRDKRKMVGGLKTQLRDLKMSSAVETRFMGKDSTATNEALRRLENCELADMRKELGLLQHQIEIETSVHQATVDFLRRASTTLQEESISWGTRHDEELAAKGRELELLKQNHVAAERRLREGEERWRMETRLRDERDNSAAREREMGEMGAQVHLKRVAAAIRIQAAWRGHLVRSAGKRSKAKGAKAKGKAKAKSKK